MDNYYKFLKNKYSKNEDVVFIKVSSDNNYFLLFFQKDMTNYEMIEKFYIAKFEELLHQDIFDLNRANLAILKEVSLDNGDEISSYVFSGFLLIYSPKVKKLYALNNAKVPNRSPGIRSSDIAITGARDGFIENIDVNVSLIRKRIPSDRLKVCNYEIGEITKTRIALLYIEGLAEQDIVNEVAKRLETINVDCLYNISHLQGQVSQSRSLVPTLTYTSRADYCSESILTGRFAILLNSSPLAIIGPVTFFFFTDFADSSNESFWVGLIHRLLLLLALVLGLFLSGFATSILAYDVEFLPFMLLANYFNARKGISMSVIAEIIIGDGIFQLFRIAGSRPLSGINQVLLLMGSVIIGQITVSAGIISQEVMLISAISMIATYIISNNFSVNTSINFMRMIIFTSAIFFGFLGFMISSIMVIFYLVNLESFGIPLLAPFAPFSLKSIRNAFFSKAYIKKGKVKDTFFAKFKNKDK